MVNLCYYCHLHVLVKYNYHCLFDRYLSLDTSFKQIGYTVSTRRVTFYSESYVQALNGSIANGQYKCTLKGGESIQANTDYDTLTEFESCSLINGGFNAGGLASTFNDSSLWALTGYNGRCSVFYGLTGNIVSEPLETDALSVGGKLFYRLGNTTCTMGE